MGTIKLLEKKIGKKHFDMDLRNDFLGMTPKAQAAKSKVNEWDCIRLKSFYMEKATTDKMKRQPI